MTQEKISEVISRFINTAKLAEEAGFTGVQVHAAHGYLLSQFLSPLTNHRQDQWGGSIENRARILIEIVKGIRAAVASDFAVAVKINSADFQRGGFSPEDAQSVITMLNEYAVDLVELSGGSYEAPAMHGRSRDERTLSREAYFLEFAKEIRQSAKMPTMVTGGIRRSAVAEEVLDSGVDMVGIATALAIEPNLPEAWRAGKDRTPELKPIMWNNKPLASLAYMAVVKYQLLKLSEKKPTKPNVAPSWALVRGQLKNMIQTYRYRKSVS